MIELHGGTVEAQSPGEGQGSTIIVRLPLRSMPPEITAPTDLEPMVLSETLDRLNGKNPPLTLQGLCILAVDDQADSRELIKWMLEPTFRTSISSIQKLHLGLIKNYSF